MDISEESTWFVKTPSPVSKRLPFYINEYGHYIAYSSYFTERQGQENYLLLYTISGSGLLKYVDQEYILKQNQAAVIYCDNYHLYKTLSVEPWRFMWVHFNGTSAREHYSLLNEDSLSIISIDDPVKMEKMLQDLHEPFDINDIPSNVRASAQLTKLMSYLVISKFTPINNKKYQEHRAEIEKIISYIQSNYTHKISLDELTKIAYMSKFYFLRVFKSHTGLGPYEYLLNYRINKAKEILKNTGLSVREISEAVGFENCNNFIREFKKIVGRTPLSYRKYANM
jgi:AraC-like DNA-binding protein